MKYVVTGGNGFVGRALVYALIEQGHSVCSVQRRSDSELEDRGATVVQLDLSEFSKSLSTAFTDADAVFHTAARVGMWGKYTDFYKTNVVGTRNVIEACQRAGVSKLIYTSSPSVVADGTSLCNVNESQPYPDHYTAFYPQTKAMAEQEVLAAHTSHFRTVSLRPHLIWGPGDTNLIPTILERAGKGKLVQVGDGKNLVDLSFIEDCVAAHLCALEALALNEEAGGRAYFISQGDPVRLWDWINQILKVHSIAPVTKNVPASLAKRIASLAEWVCKALPHYPEPFLTRFLIEEMSTSHYFDISAARELLKFSPKYTVAQAMQKTFGESSSSKAA